MTRLSTLHCRFCAISSGFAAGRAEFDRPWLQDSKYFAIASVGALVPGWSLVVPKRHVLNLSDDFVRYEFYAFVEEAANRVESKFGKCIVFEHGCVTEDSLTGCGTGHAHIHLVPWAEISRSAFEFDQSLTWSQCEMPDVRTAAAGSEYLFLADKFEGKATSGYLATLAQPRSQFFRKVIANALGRNDEADYRTHRHEEIANRTAVCLREHSAVAA